MTLPGPLAENPSLDRWVSFPAPGEVTICTGRVEIGQGVLTAMAQIAADELDVAIECISIRSGDTDLTPNEGYTAGSQSIQFGGIALRQVCADVRALFLIEAARVLGCDAAELAVRDGQFLRDGDSIGQNYWTLAGDVSLARNATGTASHKPVKDYAFVGSNTARLDLAAKVFGAPVFIHDMALDGMVHARVVRQPNRGATISERSMRPQSAAPRAARSSS